jgi:hypothetical protein
MKALFRLSLTSLAALAIASCYSTGDGTAPPTDRIYFPVGMAVSRGGNVLYVANSDFDLQYSGGTLQSYNLQKVRLDAAAQAAIPCDVPASPADGTSPARVGEACAPPVDSRAYFREGAIIGAFATDAQVLSCEREPLTDAERLAPETQCVDAGKRLFVPVRGDASVTWAALDLDDPTVAPPTGEDDNATNYAPYRIQCGAEQNGGRCSDAFRAGRPSDVTNSRRLSMPGEPFGMSLSQDGTFLLLTHQTEGNVSLLSTGVSRASASAPLTAPSLQWVLGDNTIGGTSIAPIPHDRALRCVGGAPCNNEPAAPAFVQTSRYVAGLDVFRLYRDEGARRIEDPNLPAPQPALPRPYLIREGTVPISTNIGGADSRGVVVDRSPRLACKAKVRENRPASETEFKRRMEDCARLPARVFIANRSPASLIVGEVGADELGSPNPDRITLKTSIPLSFGPSRLYLAPIVDRSGRYALRVFVVCFDASIVFVYDPETDRIENVIRMGLGPFAMAFDPFDMEQVATHALAPKDTRAGAPADLLRYRFAYVASFTNSYVQIIDLDNSRANKDTFERVVFNLGIPTDPKGS